ncbi:CDC50/LEM3 family [Gilbertella persicaria]|nr:CDC50/LEM3 family [Gilbertella persicaria]KAI8065393.1 CDC50/LEM3 family [Gilbertella persicaria]
MSDEKSKRPSNTAFKQQRLKAWQPLLTPKTVLPTLFVAGIIFAPLGGLFLYESETVNEVIVDYTHCKDGNASAASLDSSLYSYKFTDEGTSQMYAPTYRFIANTTEGEPGTCIVRFTVPISLQTPVFLYYRLTNFYQNHRKYVKSLSYNQLHGDVISAPEAASSCSPVGVAPDNKIYYPCGLIANSMFNDTFVVTLVNPAGGTTTTNMNFSEKDIAWPSDKKRLASTQMNPEDLVPPPNWQKRYPNGYTADNIFQPQEDEHFQVWMRTSWYPTFRKLYSALREGTLEAGTYEVNITLSKFYSLERQ